MPTSATRSRPRRSCSSGWHGGCRSLAGFSSRPRANSARSTWPSVPPRPAPASWSLVQPGHLPHGRGHVLHGRLRAARRPRQRHARRTGSRQHRPVAVRLLPGDQGPRPWRLSGTGPRAVVDRRGDRRSSPTPSSSPSDTGPRSSSSTDGVLGQAMEPVVPAYRMPARPSLGWEPSGAAGRPPRVIRSLHLRARGPRDHNRHLQAKYRAHRRRRGPLGGRDARGCRARDRRLRDRGAGRPDGDPAGARARV